MRKFRWIPKVIAAVCVIGILGLIVYVSTHNVRKSLYTELTREELIDWSQSSYENEWEVVPYEKGCLGKRAGALFPRKDL